MVAALVGDPARANMLTALMAGHALTASELAREAGVTPQTASSHLAKLEAGGLIGRKSRAATATTVSPSLRSPRVLEAIDVGWRPRRPSCRPPGPKDPAMRRARVCYDHLAGDLAWRCSTA